MYSKGQRLRFKTSGYEVADIRNASPPAEAEGVVNGPVEGGYVPLWCEREGREPTTIYVSLSNISHERGDK